MRKKVANQKAHFDTRLSAYFLCLFFVLSSFLVFSCPASAQLMLTDSVRQTSLNGFFSVYEDPSASETISDIITKDAQGAFLPVKGGYSGGYSASRIWLRLEVRSESRITDWVLTLGVPFLNEVDLYRPQPDGTIQHAQHGERTPPSERDMITRGPAFKLPLRFQENSVIYISVKSEGTLAVTGTLWQRDQFLKFEKYDTFIISALCSSSILVLIFSLASALFSGSYLGLSFLLYSFVNTYIYFYTDGVLSLYIFDDMAIPIAIVPFFNGLIVTAGSLMVDAMLNLRLSFPRWGMVFRLNAVVGIVLAIVGLWSGNALTAPVILFQLLFIIFSSISIAIILSLKKDMGAIIFLVSFSAILIPSVPIIFRNAGLIDPNYVLPYAQHLGVVCQSILLSLGVAQQTRAVEKARHIAQQTLLTSAWQAERQLEERVEQRTRALAKANSALADEIIERRQIEGRLLQAREQAEAALDIERRARREQRNFLAMVSHEFRVPLAIVETSAQILHLTLPPEQGDALAEIAKVQRATGRMTDLLETCLADEWLDSTRMTLRLERLDLVWLVQDVCEEFASLVAAERMRLSLPDQAVFQGDATLIRVVVSNLIDNALKYSPVESPIDVCIISNKENIVFDVNDQGGGISVEEREQIFDKFFRSPSVGRIGGAGLGLYVVKKIVTQHQGTITCSPGKGGIGTLFRVTLPTSAKGGSNSPPLS